MKTHFVQRALWGAVALAAVPAAAAAATPAPAQSHASATTSVGQAVDDFYRGRGNVPLWLGTGSGDAAARLVQLLRRAPLDGLADGPEIAAAAEAALARGQLLEADRILSSGWVRFVHTIRTPTAGMVYGDPALVPQRPGAEMVLAQAAAARTLAAHVEQIAHVNPFYAQLRQAAHNAVQFGGPASPDRRVLANLERARTIPGSGRYIMVDTAAQQLFMVEDGQVRDRMKVVVGKPDHATPMIASTIHYATLNPYWNVPADLVRANIAPHVVRQGAGYLKEKRYEVLSGFGEDAQVIAPSEVDWKAVADGRATVRVRQLPGGGNFMGDMKFGFANSGGIFLHDTPDRHLFREATRTFSSGCVRLEDAPRLARWLLGRDPTATTDAPEQHVKLPEAVPVYITYLTAQVKGGQLAFVEDVYGRDRGTRMAFGW